MQVGTVKWFNTTKGYGFITPDHQGSDHGHRDNKSNDVFVHISEVEKSGVNLHEGQKISYELKTANNKTSAVNLKLV